jgi:ubiquinol-cytochrome c reductase cytochrome b subunit
MFASLLILMALPFTDLSRSRGIQFRPLSKIAFYVFVGNFLILMQIGAKHAESPFIELGQTATVLYFLHFLIIIPVISIIENSMIELPNYKETSNNKQNNPIKAMNISSVLIGIIFLLLINNSILTLNCDAPTP